MTAFQPDRHIWRRQQLRSPRLTGGCHYSASFVSEVGNEEASMMGCNTSQTPDKRAMAGLQQAGTAWGRCWWVAARAAISLLGMLY